MSLPQPIDQPQPPSGSPPMSSTPQPFVAVARLPLYASLASWAPGLVLPAMATLSRLEQEERTIAMAVLRGPATTLIAALEALFELYGDSGLPAGDEAAAKRFWKAWLEDLHDQPIDCVLEAIRQWRLSSARRRPQTAGQLLGPLKTEIEARRAYQRKVQAALAARRALDDVERPSSAPRREDRETRAYGAAVMRDFARQLRMAGTPPRARRAAKDDRA